jgi:protein-tyrosine phosphatase
MQITAGSLTGRFGRRPQYWAKRMVAEGLVHILATDAHNCSSRPPLLAEGARAAAELVGSMEATHMVETRPRGILEDISPDILPEPVAAERTPKAKSIWQQLIDVVRA